MVSLETPRLKLRPWASTDVDAYLCLAADVGFNCFSIPGQFTVRNRAEAEEKVRQRLVVHAKTGLGKFLIFERATNELVGTCGMDPYPVDGKEEMELGYRLRLQHWGQGYATEAARAVLDYGFAKVGLQRVVAFALPQNAASVKVIEKLAFRAIGTILHAGLTHRLYETLA